MLRSRCAWNEGSDANNAGLRCSQLCETNDDCPATAASCTHVPFVGLACLHEG
ncbi:MAG: hypothetical protein H0U74_10340 [Bradymonadaceae bacterium]|nr:hypothetical protein [Lujinxingiaceae bacterium]